MNGPTQDKGRLVLLIDVLGFRAMIESRPLEAIYGRMDRLILILDNARGMMQGLEMICYSDSILIYQESQGYSVEIFDKCVMLASMAFIWAAIDKELPFTVRGALAFGDFEAGKNSTGKYDIFAGRALVQAHDAEQKENWLGVVALPEAWEPYAAARAEVFGDFSNLKRWTARSDRRLMLNPFWSLSYAHFRERGGAPETDETQEEKYDCESQLRAFRFIVDCADRYARIGDFSSRIATKYHVTVDFMRNVLGEECFLWAKKECKVLPMSATL